jgi:hypothetical protein
MQTLEDFGLFCLTWLKADATGDPLGAFLNTSTKGIFEFYTKCISGLTDQELMIIWCLPSVEEALKAKAIKPSDIDDYQNKLQIVFDNQRIVLKSIAAPFTKKPQGQIGNLSYGDTLNMFFNVKHGVKVLWNSRPYSESYFKAHRLTSTFVPILVGPNTNPKGLNVQRGLYFGGLDLTEDILGNMNRNCYFMSTTLSEMAEVRLDALDHPKKSKFFSIPRRRFIQELYNTLKRSSLSDAEKAAMRKKWPLE